MGLTNNMIKLILSSKEKHQVSFEDLIMIGRQNLHLNSNQLKNSLSYFGYDCKDVDEILRNKNGYAEPLFEFLGAKRIDSLDASPYENASIIQDLNEPLNNKYNHKYDIVLDSGTLEHVFNFPEAIKTCMSLVKEQGCFIGIYPCNNFFGHGFYQFSSELFYRVFSKENGFEIIDVIVFIDKPDTCFYSIPDTSNEYQRVEFHNNQPTYIYVLAKRKRMIDLFNLNPLQMDYSQIKWKEKRNIKVKAKAKKVTRNFIPRYFKNLVKLLLKGRLIDDSDYFKKSFFKKYQLK